jgi:hypothetical protein
VDLSALEAAPLSSPVMQAKRPRRPSAKVTGPLAQNEYYIIRKRLCDMGHEKFVSKL